MFAYINAKIHNINVTKSIYFYFVSIIYIAVYLLFMCIYDEIFRLHHLFSKPLKAQ